MKVLLALLSVTSILLPGAKSDKSLRIGNTVQAGSIAQPCERPSTAACHAT
ncbi:hypothetical protein [Haloferula helveola]